MVLASYGLVGYFPNPVSRQFGLTQLIPKSFYAHAQDICLGCTGMTEGYFRSYLKNTEKHKYELNPFSYQNSISSTKEFQDWWDRHYLASIPSGDALHIRVSSGFKSLPLEHTKATVSKGLKSKNASTSTQQSMSLPIKEEKRNIDADLGRVIANVSSQLKTSASVEVTEKKKKKEKNQNEDGPKEQHDNAQNPLAEASDAVEGPEKPKDKKKKKKLKKVQITSTSTKVSEHNNESSNSCLQPPPVKVPVSTTLEIPKENLNQEIPLTEDGNVEGPQQDSPRVEKKDTVDEGSKEGKDTVVEGNPVVDDQSFNEEKQQQDQNPNRNEEPSNQKSPSFNDADMGHYIESSNEEDISAQPGGSSIDPQSSTSKISAVAGIPESLLQGLDVSTPEEALEKLLSGVASIQTVKGLQLLRRMRKQLGSNKHTWKLGSLKIFSNTMC
ncbi:hypothetical protein QL285_015310 [Trifolium repens]|nr:hypothetical protein QL285_015310 [Trifolium repens]